MKPLLLAFALVVSAPQAFAQQQPDQHDHDADKKSQDQSGASMRMHRDMMKGSKQSMDMKPSGDVDRDFVRMMRHHHQMGVRMAEHEMQNGKDDEVKAMARKIAESQKQEMEQFDAWLKSRGAAKK
jgi:uncharacterized protein (DUF305 family)